MKLLLSAFACLPNYGTESGNGWNWSLHFARAGHEVYVLTRKVNRDRILTWLADNPQPNLSFIFVEVPFAEMFRRRDRGLYYIVWQICAFFHARRLLRRVPVDVIHHVTYGSIHMLSLLGLTGTPFVFGPVGGGQTAPAAMLPIFGRSQWKERVRTAVTRLLPYSPLHRYLLRRMSLVIAGNPETVALANRCGCRDVDFQLDFGLPADFYAEPQGPARNADAALRLLWTGALVPRKALSLALDAMALVRENATLVIVGGEASASPDPNAMIAQRGLTGRVRWHSRVNWLEMKKHYAESDCLLFTSLRDSLGAQLVEAAASGMPIICFDHQGAAAFVSAEMGYRVAVTTPVASARALAEAIDRFGRLSPGERAQLSLASLKQAGELRWDRRIPVMEACYQRAIRTAPRRPHRSILSGTVPEIRPPAKGESQI